MDIVYIFNGGDSESLKFSLRSIAKNGRNVGRVFVITETLPEWCNTDTVNHIYYESRKDVYKQNDMIMAWLTAIKRKEIAGIFLNADDDYFYIKETDFQNYPLYLKGVLPTTTVGKQDMGGENYVRSLINTRAILKSANLNVMNYEQHCCSYVVPELITQYQHVFESAYLLEKGATFNSIMGNIIDQHLTNIKIVKRKDNKIKGCYGIVDLKKQIGDTECFSITDEAMNNGVRDVLNFMFSEKCKYEK